MEKPKPSNSPAWIWGASFVASGLTEVATVPIDVCKVRLQVQSNASTVSKSTNVRYNGMLDAMIKIPQHEGIAALYKGAVPAVIRQCCYSSISMVLFPIVRDVLTRDKTNPAFYERLLAGGIAGGIGIAVMNPTEVLKTQMQTNTSSARASMASVARRVYATEGILGFWAGVGPNIMRCFLVNAAELGTYDQAKHTIQQLGLFANTPVLQHAMASGVAGLASACTSTPADVVKTRLMNQAGNKHAYNGVTDAFTGILRDEGLSALYKGFTAILVRKVVWCTIFFVSYEQILLREFRA
eukprot:m.670920 g.670920  ORF g.670920 m.670920 type:complete len:297 (+) comp22768_c0_seq5:226-1116(+)